MKAIELKYKAETGCDPFFEIETDWITKSFDSVAMEGMSGDGIRELIDYDCEHNAGWGIFLNQVPEKYQECDNVNFYTPEYVEWLENEVERLTPKN